MIVTNYCFLLVVSKATQFPIVLLSVKMNWNSKMLTQVNNLLLHEKFLIFKFWEAVLPLTEVNDRNHVRSSWNPSFLCFGTVHILKQLFSNFKVHRYYLKILLQYRLWLSNECAQKPHTLHSEEQASQPALPNTVATRHTCYWALTCGRMWLKTEFYIYSMFLNSFIEYYLILINLSSYIVLPFSCHLLETGTSCNSHNITALSFQEQVSRKLSWVIRVQVAKYKCPGTWTREWENWRGPLGSFP